MAGERLPARFSLRSQRWFRWKAKCFETATSHMQTVTCKRNEPVQKQKTQMNMNRLLIVIGLIILFSNRTYSQKKIDFEFYGAPLYSYRTYKSLNYIDPNLFPAYRHGKDFFDNVFKPETDQLEKPILRFSAGFKVSSDITNNVNLQIGLEYTSIGEKADFGLTPLYKYVDWGGQQVLMPSIDSYHLTMTYTYNYLSLPILIKYKICSFNKFEIAPLIGCSFDFLINKKVDNTSEKTELPVVSKFDNSNHEFKKFSGAISIGLEFNYSISDKLELYISPNFKQYILPNEIVMPMLHVIGGETFYFDKINKYNYTIGINTGLRFINILDK